MNPVTIQRIFNQSESTGKYRYGGKKPINGDMRRMCEEDDLKKSNNVRRKQTKVRYDTWRRSEMPNEKDEKLENIHYSNFLGDKYGDNNAPYNSEYPVSLRYCDSMREYEPCSTEARDSLDEECSSNYYDYDEELEEEEEELFQTKMIRFYAQEYAREVANFDEMVEYCVNMYCAITKRAREQEDDSEQPPAKRARCDDESNNV